MTNNHSALVIGGGVAGLQATLDLARVGFNVYLVEVKPRIGGHTSLLCKIFPTFESGEELTKQLFQNVIKQSNAQILPYSEIKKVEGSVGDFKVSVLKKTRYVDEEKCTACGECEKACPVTVPKDYEMGIGFRRAVYLPSPHPVPSKYLIDPLHCLYFKDGSCHACRDVCPENAVVFEQKAEEETLDVEVIVVATGFKPWDATRKGQYKYGVYRNVITGIEYERLCNPNGPTQGKIVRIDNKENPRSVAYILCVGSRDEQNHGYCCRVGCPNSLKHAYLLKDQYGGEVEAYVCYTDMRAVGRKAEEFYRNVRESGVNFIHGEPSEIRELPDGSLTIDVYDQATSKLLSITTDLIVLEAELEPKIALQEKLKIPLDEDGFFKEIHPQLAANETPVKGIFLAGAVQEPMNIAEAIIRASAAATRAFVSIQRQ
ncbi:MAG: CoB--CoM heterodisulfide reductase iron-sulfur subunit A family protein [Candidatus Bathyarchaeota archaeon]|nr:CoB--CoM heterodisulfide reductase iron-sulfur subunit A family protein [Candidatus Bathyarchaeota archaeon]MDH5712328.1 CoB--CoM heterodisulfide reductase iron-sulfur subunit A family protein [Candidatus Bathyarchaeota archaeon]